MNPHYLEKLFSPSSIVVVGASDRVNSVGAKVFKNLLQADFKGKLYAANLKHTQIQGQTCFSSVKKIQSPIDLAIIATPANTVPNIIKECGEQGIHTAIILSSGFSEVGKAGIELENAVLSEAHRYHMRIVGPNCLGIMRPYIKMNATFDNNFSLNGTIALVSQSGALSAGILDWAINKKIGFSTIVSLGNNADIDFSDILDYLALDPLTESILLYIEGIKHSRHFMSALRVAARIKPVIVIKAGKNSQGSRAALSHTGALIGSDDVFDAALIRAGAVRVSKVEDLFSAAEILSNLKKIKGNRLAIITNGGGAGVMAADRAYELNINLPSLNQLVTSELNKVLPSQWSHQNPIDIIGDATPERYHAALDICNKDENIDGILVILVPVAMANPFNVAKQIIKDARQNNKLILACWMGEKHVKSSWKLFAKYHIPYFDTPEKAVEAFSYLANYYHNQQLLMQVPGTTLQFKPDVSKALSIIDSVLADQRSVLTIYESKEILKAFEIPVTETIQAKTIQEAIDAIKLLEFPLVMKINSPDISHKSAAGGVRLNINSEDEVRKTFKKLMDDAEKNHPDANIFGITLESQYENKYDREVMVGVIQDIVFGPIISFGAGGTLVEIMNDRALALPPLNRFIAHQLISKTKALKLGSKLRSLSADQIENIVSILLRVSDMVCKLPHIQEMDINPFIINETGMIAVDARMVVAPQSSSYTPYHHLAIYPYPNHLVSSYTLADGASVTFRPIRPEDAELEQDFTRNLSPQSKYFRFMEHFRELTPSMLVRFTQIDYDREMAIVALHSQPGKETMAGVARYVKNPDNATAEFAIVIADDWQNKGLGYGLMNFLLEIAKNQSIKTIMGVVLANNKGMLELVKQLGFSISNGEDPTLKSVTKSL